ncbi:hypothetical protein M2337_003097 [Sphingobium sp. B2D3A]|nr:hypothetical protein [Sphingobium sp. B2D3A]
MAVADVEASKSAAALGATHFRFLRKCPKSLADGVSHAGEGRTSRDLKVYVNHAIEFDAP